jgi:hypothetical protein
VRVRVVVRVKILHSARLYGSSKQHPMLDLVQREVKSEGVARALGRCFSHVDSWTYAVKSWLAANSTASYGWHVALCE